MKNKDKHADIRLSMDDRIVLVEYSGIGNVAVVAGESSDER